jgi:hypothetical protein
VRFTTARVAGKDQRGDVGPGRGDDPGGEGQRRQQQPSEDRPHPVAAEGAHRVHRAEQEGVYREEDDERADGDAWPDDRDHADGDAEQTAPQQRVG